ncbi:membrane protein insertase YidC, partial [Candidatus Dependentiae bacterium]|nr:membrane protein insertase YidC [Candidatus Dependentiae bacterium]
QQELLKKHGVPGAAGCLTALIQFPVFFALRPILSDSFSLYQAPFLWIKDLSAPDPYSVLPIIMAGGMIAQALVGDPKQRNMMLGMGLLIGTIAMNMTSGLALYLLVSTLFGFFQKFLSTKLKLA